MVSLNKISCSKFEHSARKFVTGLGKGDALLPIILLEAAVTGGRTYNAHKRGGFIEARERGTEETLGAIFWLWGVTAFNKMGDAIGKRILGLNNVNFEVGKDAVRNPIKNYIKKTGKYGDKTLAAFKFTKIISSIVLANAVIGFVVPKLNQAITRRYQKSIKNTENNNKTATQNLDNKANTTEQKDKKATSFKGLNVQSLLALSDSFENDARYKLLSTDLGIAGGRAVNARNKYERQEILFRDLGSIYFYMFCRSHINSLLNYMGTGRATRLDPVSTQLLDQHLRENLKDKKSYTAEEFEKAVFGNRNTEVPSAVKNKIQNGIIKLDDFKSIVGEKSDIAKFAERMSKLQPPIEGVSILTSEQVKDVYSKGLINTPEALKGIFEAFSNKKSTDPMMFYPEKELRSLKQRMVDYVEDIIKKAKTSGENITLETLKKANKANFMKNSINLGIGFAVSAYFLSTAIPKIQYWMTRMRTGMDKFPGVEEYDKKGCNTPNKP